MVKLDSLVNPIRVVKAGKKHAIAKGKKIYYSIVKNKYSGQWKWVGGCRSGDVQEVISS